MNEIGFVTTFEKRIEQGDILKDIDFIQKIKIVDDFLEVDVINFPFVIVLTQDCDLEQDSKYYFNNPNPPSTDDKKLFSVIVAPIYNEGLFLAGEHLEDESMKLKMQKIPKISKGKPTTTYNNLINNEIPRYHYLKFNKNSLIPDSIIDFKHYFTVNNEAIMEDKKDKFICKIDILYRESISQRFAYFLSRIGLPNN